MTRRGFVYTEIVVVMVILAVMWILFVPAYSGGMARAYEHNCASNLQEIGVALRAYAADYDSAFPGPGSGLEALGTSYAPEPEVFRCPQARVNVRQDSELEEKLTQRRGPSGRGDYAYRPGLYQDDLPLLAVAADSTYRHRSRASVLYVDGHVRIDMADTPPAGALTDGEFDVALEEGG